MVGRRLSAFMVAVLSMQVAAVLTAEPAQAVEPVAPPSAKNPTPVVRTVMTPGPTILDGANITTDTVWGPEGSPYVIRNQLSIEEQASLTLLPGTVLKMDGQYATVVAFGQLLSLGTPDRHVVITSYKDDTVLGDTNGDGAATAPARGDWYSVRVSGSLVTNRTVGVFDYTDFRWGGYGSGGMCGSGSQLDLWSSSRAVVSNSSFTEAPNNGISVGSIGPNGFVGIYNNFFDRTGCGMYTQKSSQVEVVGNTFGSSISKWSFMSNGSYKLRLWFNTFSSKPAVLGSPRPTRATADVRYNSFLAGVYHWGPSWQDLDDWSQNWWGHNVNTFALPACASTAQANAATPPWSLNTSTRCGDTSTYTYPVTGYSKPVLPTLSGAPGTVPGAVNEASAPRYGPVDTQSGALSYQASDLVVQDAGKQVTATRSYRSDSSGGDVGAGWTSAFSEALSTANGTATMSTSDGGSIGFGTDPAAGYVPAPGVSAGFSSDANGSQVTTPGQDTYQFDPNGALTGMLLGDPGHKLDIARSGGQLDRVTGVSGRFLAYIRDDGKLRSVNDSTGRSVGFAYSDGRLAAASGVDGKSETYSYDGNGRLTEVTTPSGRTKLAAEYGADGKVAWVEQEGTGRSTFHYDPTNRRTTIDLPDGAHVEQRYDTSGRLVTDQLLGGSGRHVIYDGEGRATVVVTGVPTVPMTGYGPAANTTFFDGNGDPAMQVDPQGVMVRTTFAAHKPLVTTFGNGTTITRTYDASGRLATVTDQRGKLWRYTFNDRGQATGRTDPLGRTATYVYAANGDRAGVTDETGATTTYDNDAQGRPTAITDPLGRRRTIAYTAWDAPERITQPRGGVYAITFDDDRRRTASSDPSGTTRYDYDDAGRLSASTDPAGGRTTVEYDAVGRPTRITNPRGGVITRQYSVEGWPTQITDAAGAVTRTEYDPAGRTIRITDALGQVTQTVYDRAGRAVKAQTPDGATRTSSYDVMGRLTQSTTPLGRKWLQAYDAAGNPTVTTDPLGKTIVVGYDDLSRPVSRTDQAGVVSTIAYDDAIRTTTVTDPLGVVQAASTDAAGQLIKATDGRGATTVREYDADGNLAKQIDPTGAATSNGYDLAGHATSTADPLGRTTSGEYDSLGRLTKRTWPDTTTETFAYDAVGNLTRHTDRTGASWTYDFEAANNVSSAKDPLGNETRFTHDALGRLTKTTDPTGVVEATGYDPVGRPAVRSDASGASWVDTYDLDGNVLTSTDPASVKVTNTYDVLGRLTKITANGYPRELTLDAIGRVVSYDDEFNQVSKFEYDVRGRQTATINPLQQRTTYAYDGAGNLLTETPPSGHAQTRAYDLAGRVGAASDALGNTSRYTYNAAGELTALQLPRGGVYTYSYDAAGRTASETDPRGAITRYAYDGEGRPTSTTRPSGQVVTNSYDAAGRRTQSAAGTETRSYGYDAAGRITSAGNLGFGYDNRGLLIRGTDAGGDTTYAYDAAQRLSARTPPGGVTTTFSYTGSGLLSQVRGGTNLNYTYDYAGRSVTRTSIAPTVGSDTRTFDAALRPTEVRSGGGTFKVSAQYTPDGQISSLAQTAPGNTASNTTAFGYDDAGRLTSAGTATYGWDADGNRTSESGVAAVYDEANRLTGTSDGSTYTYDADGNLTDVSRPTGSTHYDYNAFGELVSASTGTSTVTYGRDALGRSIGSGGNQLSYDGTSTQLSQYRSGSTKTDLVREPTGGLLAENTQGSGSSRVWQTIHGDLGMVTNPAGTAQYTAVYDPFGKATTTGTAPVPLGFQSMPTDPVTGLVDMGARSYDAVTGRFTQVDTVVGDLTSPVTLNRYTYGNADPLNYFDPDGHWSIPGWDAVKSFVSTAVNWVSDRVDEATSWVATTAQQVGNSVVNAAASVFSGKGAVAASSSAQVAQHNDIPWLTDILRSGFQLAYQANAAVDTINSAATGANPLADLDISWSDIGHAALDIVGLVPVIGEAADLANAAWYAADGDYLNAGLSAAAAIPFLGYAATGAKLAIKGADAVRGVVKASDKIATAVKGADEAAAAAKGADEAAPLVPKPASAKVSPSKAEPSAGRACNCFPAGTEVATADGDKNIEDVQVGDQVWARDLTTGESHLRPVVGLFSKQAERLVTIEAGEQKIEVTPEHPFWVVGRGWVDAGELREGDQLLGKDGAHVPIAGITVRAEHVEVYNFEVAGDHNYYITDAQLLVHNCDVRANKNAGDAVRDRLAEALEQTGAKVEKEVYRWTPFGARFIDIQVSRNGKVIGAIEVKTGGSRYRAKQRAKDAWLRIVDGYQVQLVRLPRDWGK